MHTAWMIGLLVIGAVLSAVAAWTTAIIGLGRVRGTGITLAATALAVMTYRSLVRPWHLGWGATDEEARRAMPGDELLPGASSATRAVTIAASADAIWPWLVQLGYGRAGWYSYDWIDNDFRASADRVVPELQDLQVGDRILMMPGMGFVVRSIDEPRAIVSLLEDGSTSWCLGLYPQGDGTTRLVSRWRPHFERSLATWLMLLLVEPGTFVMEQKMLRTLRDRVEAANLTAKQTAGP